MHNWRHFEHRMMSSHCKSNPRSIWNMICNGEYPEDLNSKYGGYMIKDGEPYTVFSLDKNPLHYLLFFRSTEVSECVTLDFVNSTTFNCLAGVGKPKPLHYPRSRLTCINYSFRMADELVSYCTTRFLPNNEYTAILYAEYDEKTNEVIRGNNRCSVLSTNDWLILVIALISLLIIFRLR